jgi:hypothetical protein
VVWFFPLVLEFTIVFLFLWCRRRSTRSRIPSSLCWLRHLPYLFTIDRLFLSIVEMFRINFYRVSLNFSFRNTKLIGAYVIERITTPIRNVHSLSDLALNKICFWHFITMSQSTKRRWNSGPSTPSSTSKKKKYNCKFQDEWKKSHHWLESSSCCYPFDYISTNQFRIPERKV